VEVARQDDVELMCISSVAQVSEISRPLQELGNGTTHGIRQFGVVVHVHSDHAFKKYLETCGATDLPLYRGLLLKVP
jgi:hypothetical protein